MHKFFVENENIKNDQVIINGNNKNHITNVLRMKIGEKVLISNKDKYNTFECEIIEINKDKVICNINKEIENKTETRVKIDIFQGIPKSDKMEYIIQKSVELGANSIIPVNMKYCIAKIKDEEKKNARWQKIAESAAKQSKRDIIPVIENSKNIEEICERIKEYDLVLVAYENEENITIKDILQSNNDKKSIAVVIGPEGGISEEEISKLKENGAKVVSLGKRILRTETASLAVLSMIMYEYDF